jgi:hypothetical protein
VCSSRPSGVTLSALAFGVRWRVDDVELLGVLDALEDVAERVAAGVPVVALFAPV